MSALKLSFIFLSSLLVLPGFNAFVQWNSLKATWCPGSAINEHCFQDIPRTVELAKKSGWRDVNGSTCLNDGKFFGHRMVKNDDYTLTPLYDEQGIIAGIQINALKSELFATSNPYKFDAVPDFLDNSIENHPIYSLTTYFVIPTNICSHGRTLRLLDTEGTAERIYFQTGNSPKHLREIPIYRNAAEKRYTSTNCVPTMGHHNYYNVPKMQASNCTTFIPSFLLFNNNGELHGFGFAIIGKMSSPSMEHPNRFAVKMGFGPITPECMLTMSDSPGLPGFSNIHLFFTDNPRDIKCAPIIQTKAVGNLIHINPNVFKKQ